MDTDTFWIRANQVLTMPDSPAQLHRPLPTGESLFERDLDITGAIEDGGILVDNTEIAWVGPWSDRPNRSQDIPILETGVATPGWIDCHTHSVFGGNRSREYVIRNTGQSYAEILESGGGILESVEQTRKTPEDTLVATLEHRVWEFVSQGVTTLEIKSGYGLDLETEIKQLEAIRRVRSNSDLPCELVPCFMGAHAIPPDYKDDPDGYVDLVCETMIPALSENASDGLDLADYCDVFCDQNAFSASASRHILETGREYGLIGRMHADELGPTRGVEVACELGIASVDHLEYTDPAEFEDMVDADVTAVLMPAVNLTLGTTDRMAKARQMLEAGVEIALSTDFNPGSAPTQNLSLMLSLGCTLYGLTPGEVLRGVTVGAARALERSDIGRIEEGTVADLTLLDAENMMHLPYHLGANQVAGVIKEGRVAYTTPELTNQQSSLVEKSYPTSIQ